MKDDTEKGCLIVFYLKIYFVWLNKRLRIIYLYEKIDRNVVNFIKWSLIWFK